MLIDRYSLNRVRYYNWQELAGLYISIFLNSNSGKLSHISRTSWSSHFSILNWLHEIAIRKQSRERENLIGWSILFPDFNSWHPCSCFHFLGYSYWCPMNWPTGWKMGNHTYFRYWPFLVKDFLFNSRIILGTQAGLVWLYPKLIQKNVCIQDILLIHQESRIPDE